MGFRTKVRRKAFQIEAHPTGNSVHLPMYYGSMGNSYLVSYQCFLLLMSPSTLSDHRLNDAHI